VDNKGRDRNRYVEKERIKQEKDGKKRTYKIKNK
jgi:hypothetical protein